MFLSSVLFFSNGQVGVDSATVEVLNEKAKGFWRSNPDSSKVLAKKALELSRELDYQHGIIQSYKNLGAYFFFTGNYDSTRYFWEKSLAKAIELGNRNDIASGHTNLGILYQRQQQYLKALESNRLALRANIEIEDSVDIGINFNNIGILYEEVRNYEKATEYLKKAIDIREKIADTVRLSSSYLNLGVNYMSMGKLDSAELMLNQSIQLKRRDNDQWGLANNFATLGQVYALRKDPIRAETSFLESIDISRKIGAKEIEVTAKIFLADLFVQSKKFEEANRWLSGLDQEIGTQTLQTQVDFYQAKATTLSNLNEHVAANQMWERHAERLDSLNEINDERLVLEAQFKLNATLKELELKRANEMRELELKASLNFRRQLILILIASLTVIGVILVILYRNYQLLKKRNALLNEQSAKISRLLKQQHELLGKKSEELITSKEVINRYAFLNSHELRAPVARILGVLNVIEDDAVDSHYMLSVLSESINEIDQIIREIAAELDPEKYQVPSE